MAAPVAKLVVNQPSRSAERVPASRRRDRIIEATVATIARFGLSRTTMERVAVAAKVSPGTVTFHFASKEALLLAALDHLAVEFDSARRGALAAVGDDPVRALLALIEVNFDPVISDRRKIAVWYAFWGEARARQEYMRPAASSIGSIPISRWSCSAASSPPAATSISMPRRWRSASSA